jgi:hypothetical protein
MNKDESKKPEQPVEGEGSYSATRRYNQHLGEAVESGDLEAGAEAARRAVEGEEGVELERAAEQAKHGPKGATEAAGANSANHHK